MNILSLSYGKDSMACLGACERLGWRIDRIITADVWATDTIPADLPEMVTFKNYADDIIKQRYGIVVEHYRSQETFNSMFYKRFTRGVAVGRIYGFPFKQCNWCNNALKRAAINIAHKQIKNNIQFIGIAADEPKRFKILLNNVVSPLVNIGWSESDCKKWCIDNNLLSPIYNTVSRVGCWFCYNASVNQLRLLKANHPDLWTLLLKWDSDSPTTFHPDGHTVHDFDKRFELENANLIDRMQKFRWDMLNKELNYCIFGGNECGK